MSTDLVYEGWIVGDPQDKQFLADLGVVLGDIRPTRKESELGELHESWVEWSCSFPSEVLEKLDSHWMKRFAWGVSPRKRGIEIAQPNYIVVLQSLKQGHKIKILGEHEIIMVEGVLCYAEVIDKLSTQTGESSQGYYQANVDLNDFIEACNRIPRDTIITIIANMTLTDLKKWKGTHVRREDNPNRR